MAEQVIDASVAIKWVVKDEPFRNKARLLLRDSRRNNSTLLGPPLLDYEVESNLQRRLYDGRMTLAAVNTALNAFYATRIRIVSHSYLVRDARDIARRFRQERIYDALYAALADWRGCEFWTADRAFFDAVKYDLPFVRYLPDYS
jgi:predicted nucleic acid-binding protein